MKTFDERKKSVEQYMSKMKRKRLVRAVSLTLAVAVLALVLFVPYSTTPPSVRRYADSEYYGLICQLNELTYDRPAYKNNFQALAAVLSGLGTKTGAAPGSVDMMNGAVIAGDATADLAYPEAAPDKGGSTGQQYEEVTDNQVQGVIEADLMKRSDKYVYYLRSNVLSVYAIAQSDSVRVGEYTVALDDDSSGKISYCSGVEMFLSADCTTVTVLLRGTHSQLGAATVLVNLDVSDPAAVTERSRVYFTGSYLSARMVDGDILLTYNHNISTGKMDFGEPETFVPRYGQPGDMTCIPAENIVCPEESQSTRYTVVCKVDGGSLEVKGTAALLGYSQQLYVSGDAVYATCGYTQKNQETFNNQYRQSAMTQITGISYAGEGLEILGTVDVEGTVKNQYSMDQYEGILRVVTSTSVSYFKETVYGEYATTTVSAAARNVNLYCVDLTDWQIAASVIGFAPDGETAESVRFDGANAYVCTAEVITLTDPVYFFDLSDLEHITWTDTGTINGYSTSLIQLGDGYLMGIGYGSNILMSGHLKIEIYEEVEGAVVSVCTYEAAASFSEEYKSYLVDRENKLIGLHILNRESGTWEYVLLHFDGYQLHEVTNISTIQADVGNTRAFLADGWLYVLCDTVPGIYTKQVW